MFWWYQKLKLRKSLSKLSRGWYSWEDIPSKLIEMKSSVESTSFELNLRKKKWLVNFSYNANYSNICDQLRILVKCLDTLLTNYGNMFVIGNLMRKSLTFILRIYVIYTRWKTWSKSQHVLKIRTIPRLLIWCWQTQSAVFKTHMYLKHIYLTFIKW